MEDHKRSKDELIRELEELRIRVAELEPKKGLIQEIENSQLMEEALRESEQHYSSLFKNNHSVMLLIDPVSAEIVDANPAACSFYGWTQEELTSMKITDINMLSSEQVFEEMERAKSEKRNHFFFRHRLANEDIRDVEVYSGPIRVHGKELLYSIIHDISERKRAEEALRESEHYFRSLLFNMHEDILVIDPDYRITDVNNTLLVTVGRKYEEVIGRCCYEVSHGYNEPCHSHRKGEDCMLREVFELGEPRSCRHQHVRVNGSKAWVDILLSPLRDENGDVAHVIEAIRDVTDLVEMEDVLRESEENFRALAENANDGILIAAGEEGVGVYANKRAAEITGYSVAESACMTW
jgi:PAS domain S-box-containing protein